MLSFLGICAPHSSFSAYVRCFRVLRLMIRVRQVHVVFLSITRAIPPVLNTLIFGFFFCFILAVFGMNLFADKLY